MHFSFHPLSANPTKWSNTLKQFISNLLMNCLSVLDHFVILALKWLKGKTTTTGFLISNRVVQNPYSHTTAFDPQSFTPLSYVPG